MQNHILIHKKGHKMNTVYYKKIHVKNHDGIVFIGHVFEWLDHGTVYIDYRIMDLKEFESRIPKENIEVIDYKKLNPVNDVVIFSNSQRDFARLSVSGLSYSYAQGGGSFAQGTRIDQMLCTAFSRIESFYKVIKIDNLRII